MMTMRYQLCFLVVFLLGALAAPIERRKSSQFSGDLTYYTPGLGSCGETNTATDLIAALNAPQMANGENPNKNPNCGRKARVKTKKGSVTVKIVSFEALFMITWIVYLPIFFVSLSG